MNFNFNIKVKMKMIVKIAQKVSIESKYLDSCIGDHLLNKLQSTVSGKCSLEYGYIIKVNKIISFGGNIIARANSLVIFNVVYEAEVLKPEIGQVLSGKVCMVFQQGIFVDIEGKMKILVPATSMNSFEFDTTSFYNRKKKWRISTGVKVLIRIDMIKYEQKDFGCIGKLENTKRPIDSDSDSDSDSD